MSKYQKESSSIKKLLVYLGETSRNLLKVGEAVIFNPSAFMNLKRGTRILDDYPPFLLRKKISYLKRSKYFTFGNNTFYLTPWGREKIIKLVVKKKKDKKYRWDGRWRGIIFDIPELNRRDRSFLRKELHWMGFKELQKSVWVVPYNIEEELRALLKLWKLNFHGDIRLLKIDKIEKDTDLKKYFQI